MNFTRSVILLKAPYLEIYGSMNTGHLCLTLGPLYLHAYLRKKNVPVYFTDHEAEGMNNDDLIEYIKERNPILIGISSSTSNYPQARNLAKLIKDKCGDIFIVLGGPHSTAVKETILEMDSDKFDFLCMGEGEETLYELYCALSENDDLKNVDGLAFKKDGDLIINKSRDLIENLDNLPFPSRDQVDLSRYKTQANFFREVPISTLITSRGCPFQCDYCQTKNIHGNRMRFHSAEYVLGEIEEMYHRYGIRYLGVLDDVFAVNNERLNQIMEGIQKRGINIKFWCMARANMINEDVIKTLKAGGLDSVSIGVESGDEDILKDIGKGVKKEEVENAFYLLKKHKIETQAFLMIGLYHDTYETIMKTIDFAIKLDPDFASFSVMIPYPGTKVYKKYYKDIIDFTEPDVWKYFCTFSGNPFGFGSKNFTREELVRFCSMASKKFYFRPSKILQMLLKIKSWRQLSEYSKAGWFLLKDFIAK